jgi:hypothetical protein
VDRVRLLVGFVAIAGAVAAGCSAKQPKPTGPKFSGRVLLLTGDPSKGAALAELTQLGDGYNFATITTGLTEAVASLDQTRLLYATKDEVSVRDLGSGAVKSLVKGESFCLAWAPDGNHFSYQQRSGGSTKFYVADPDGKARLILDDPNGSTNCAQWIARDRLLLDRFVGATKKTTEPLKPNTSTVATIGETVKLKDTPRKWSIESVCAKSNNGFVRSADQGQLLIARNIDHFESLDPSPAPCSDCRFIGYAAQSCVPFFTEQPTSTTTELFSLNPTNWQKQRPTSISRIFSPSAKYLIKSSARLMVVGDTPDKLLLIDTESGDVTPFFRNEAARGMLPVSPAPVVWIEN